MENIGGILGYIVGSLVGAALVGWVVNMFYTLLRYLSFLILRVKRKKQTALKPIYKLLRYILIGLPITAFGSQVKLLENNPLISILAVGGVVLWYILIYQVYKKIKVSQSTSNVNHDV